METLLKEANALREELTEYRRYLHAHAEVGFQLQKTTEYIQTKLKEFGYIPEERGKGILVRIGKGKGKILLRADMDGLPLQEETKLSYACKYGNMHACGHDIHATALLGTAKLLKEREKQLKGEVRLYFQPAEEILQGAKKGIENGVTDGVEFAVMLHVLTGTEMPTGRAIVASSGVSAPCADYFTISVKGKGCHGSSPWEGIDALTVSSRILLALQELSAREISPFEKAVLTIGCLKAGETGNVICDQAEMQGTLRCFDEETREYIKKRLIEISQGIAKSFHAKAKITFQGGCPSLYNDKKASDFALKTARALLGEDKVFASADLPTGKKVNGSEDFAYISREVPSVMIAVTAGEKKKGYAYPLHHPKAKFDEDILPSATALYTGLALRWFA